MDVNRLIIPEPFSGGIFLTYKCTNECRHCMYACSPTWRSDWISLSDAEKILKILSASFKKWYPKNSGQIGVNLGLHLTGGEPFLNFNLLLNLVKMADEHEIPSVFVETNCFWCTDDEETEGKLCELRDAGLKGILISANPFLVEYIPFERIERAIKISKRIFNGNVVVYQNLFLNQMRAIGLKGTLSFEKYLSVMGEKDPLGLYAGLSFPSILPMGRAPYRIGHLYRRYPASRFFNESCMEELTRDWHVHVDNYCNYISGYCAGISLGDARDLEKICQDGVNLDEHPIIEILASPRGVMKLFEYAVREYGYREKDNGYVSKCHLCLDIRKHIVEQTDEFSELKPRDFYRYL
ncbi:4Fe-4S cluster-binding domain-containing protein [Candidatus Bathyarchaeota archaeon]|nr:4Fe-4S cluster-binding domain-containing protein [Candidatus Bathyarchaeota archaeon]